MFTFIKGKHNILIVFDPTEPDIGLSKFTGEDWTTTAYGECQEEILPNTPQERGIGMTTMDFVDSYNAGDMVTQCPRTGFIIFLNNANIHWFSKIQTSIETSSFVSEFVAMKKCCEYIQGLRYKLTMMGINDEPSLVFGDNQPVLSNTSLPHFTLKNNSSSIAFHFVREGVANKEWLKT